jgi:hypothetical protein
MNADAPGGLRGFLRSRLGLVSIVLFCIAVVSVTFAFNALLAIPAMLLFGFGVPVWLGIKRPRILALAGLVVLLVVAPLATILLAQESLVNPGAASSPGLAPLEEGGSVLQNATISPFVGSLSTNYTWSVQVFPRFLGAPLNGSNWTNDSVQLYISTCPGATATFSPGYCPSGYSLIIVSHTFAGPTAPANGTTVTFHHDVTAETIWSWQMELLVQNRTNATNPYRIELNGDPTYDGLEGPVVGGFATAYGALIVTIYEAEFLYLGVVFFFVLLLYWWYKQREARTKAAIKRTAQAMVAASGSTPPAAGPPGAGGGAPPSPGPSPASHERACPNCGAVVYAGEAKCWKCGSPLGGSPGSAPLPSTPGGPA